MLLPAIGYAAHPGGEVSNGSAGHIAESEVRVDVVVKLDAGSCMDDKLHFWQQPLLVLLADPTVRLCQIPREDFQLVEDLHDDTPGMQNPSLTRAVIVECMHAVLGLKMAATGTPPLTIISVKVRIAAVIAPWVRSLLIHADWL